MGKICPKCRLEFIGELEDGTCPECHGAVLRKSPNDYGTYRLYEQNVSLMKGRVFSDKHWAKFSEQKDRPDREKIDELPRIETCVGCPYWKTCERTESRDIGNLSPEMLCKLEVDQILNLFKSQVEGLTVIGDEELTETAEMIFNFGIDIKGIKSLLWQHSKHQLQADKDKLLDGLEG